MQQRELSIRLDGWLPGNLSEPFWSFYTARRMLSQAHLAQDTTDDLFLSVETSVTSLGFPRSRRQLPIRIEGWLAGGFSNALWGLLTRHRERCHKHMWHNILVLICSLWLGPESLCRDFRTATTKTNPIRDLAVINLSEAPWGCS